MSAARRAIAAAGIPKTAQSCLVLGDGLPTGFADRQHPRCASSPMLVKMPRQRWVLHVARRTERERPHSVADGKSADRRQCGRNSVPRAADGMWLPPAAISTCPGRARSPSAASLTRSGHAAANRSAKEGVNFAGMCWTMTVGGAPGGSAASSRVRAATPPVDAPNAKRLAGLQRPSTTGEASPPINGCRQPPSKRINAAAFTAAASRGPSRTSRPRGSASRAPRRRPRPSPPQPHAFPPR